MNGSSDISFMTALLQYINSLTPIPSISLYKLNNDGTAFDKITLDRNNGNSIITTPCN